MKYLRFILIGLVAIFLAYVYFGIYKGGKQPNQQLGVAQGQWQTKSDEQGPVSIKITPQILSGTQWKFNVVFDTHSVDLSDDPLQIAELVDEQGTTYKPIMWQGAGPGGHHREGILIFSAISPTPTVVELKIKNVGGITERSFKWLIK